MERAVEEGKNVRVLDTNASWYGITYREDLEEVREAKRAKEREKFMQNWAGKYVISFRKQLLNQSCLRC